jgi:hypothetical protein
MGGIQGLDELLLLLVFLLAMGILPWLNIFIYAEKYQKFLLARGMSARPKPTRKYEIWASRIVESRHSALYQTLAFVTPIVIFLLGLSVWYIGQFPSWSWIPILSGLLAINMLPMLYYQSEVRWIEKKNNIQQAR